MCRPVLPTTPPGWSEIGRHYSLIKSAAAAMLRHSVLSMLIFALSACSSAAATSTPTIDAAHSDRLPTATAFAVTPATLPPPSRRCGPTHDDGVSPTYKPNTPVRSVVGHGHVLTGVVLSSKDCRPIAHVQLELWPEEGNLGHPDTSRATLFTGEDGRYHFECDPPEHIHMRISSPGYRTIGVNSYHPDGQATGALDIVLVPEKP